MENGQEEVKQESESAVAKVEVNQETKSVAVKEKVTEENACVPKKEEVKEENETAAVKKQVEEKNQSVDAHEKVTDDKPASEPSAVKEKAATETAVVPDPELLEKIKNQIEYYFGNINMQRDKFLIEQTKLDEGWIPLTIMLNFKLLASMSKDVNVILKALESSDLMEISEDRKKIRRSPKHPLPEFNEEYRKAQEARTTYVKGFPLKDTTMDKLKAFFADFEPFENIVMRKYQDKEKKFQFKGSVFVQFKTLDGAKAFLERKSVKYGDTELIIKWAADYAAEKAKEREEKRQKRFEGKGKKNANAKVKEEAESDEEDENDKESSLPRGSVIHFEGASAECVREDFKGCLGALGANIAFVDFKKGDKEGWIRLQGENAAKPLVEKMKDGKVLIQKSEISCRVLEGKEEVDYLAKAKEQMASARQQYTKNKRSGRKGRNPQRGGGRKRRNSGANNDGPAKKTAAE